MSIYFDDNASGRLEACDDSTRSEMVSRLHNAI